MKTSTLHLVFYKDSETLENYEFYFGLLSKEDEVMIFSDVSAEQIKQFQQQLSQKCKAVYISQNNDYTGLLEKLPQHQKTWTWK